jgi:hypothetical protein
VVIHEVHKNKPTRIAAPTLLGSGENLFAGLDTVALGYRCAEHLSTANATHIVLTRQSVSPRGE